MSDSDTIHALFTTLEIALFMRVVTVFTTLHENTQKHYHNQHIPWEANSHPWRESLRSF